MKRDVFMMLFVMFTFVLSPAQEMENFINAFLNGRVLEKDNLKEKYVSYDFSTFFVNTKNSVGGGAEVVLGFMGTDKRRIDVHIISVVRNRRKIDEYFVYGKLYKKDCSIRKFQGMMSIREIKKIKGQYNYLLSADYIFFEEETKNKSGTLKGKFFCKLSLSDNRFDIDYTGMLDSTYVYCDNAFVGVWSDNKTGDTKICNWGYYSPPNAGDLNVDKWFFKPNIKYKDLGWKTLIPPKRPPGSRGGIIIIDYDAWLKDCDSIEKLKEE